MAQLEGCARQPAAPRWCREGDEHHNRGRRCASARASAKASASAGPDSHTRNPPRAGPSPCASHTLTPHSPSPPAPHPLRRCPRCGSGFAFGSGFVSASGSGLRIALALGRGWACPAAAASSPAHDALRLVRPLRLRRHSHPPK